MLYKTLKLLSQSLLLSLLPELSFVGLDEKNIAPIGAKAAVYFDLFNSFD